MSSDTDLTLRVGSFEGPFDLLLVLVGRDQQLRLEIDERGRHDEVSAGRF